MPLAAFFMQAEPCPPAFGVIIFDPHGEGGGDAGKAEHHDGDQRPVAELLDGVAQYFST